MATAVSSSVQLNSVNRLSDLPLIKQTMQMAASGYEHLKSQVPADSFIASNLSRAEQTVSYVTENVAKPVILKLERPLSIADNFVCQGLDKLEEKVPAIKKSPDELKTAGWEKYEELKGFGNSKVDSIKAYGFDRVNQVVNSPYALAIMKTADTAMDLTEQAVDTYFPAVGDEPMNDTSSKDEQNVVQRMGSLSEKMRQRMYKQALNQISFLQKRSQEAVEKMRHSVDLIAYARSLEETGRQKIFSGADAVQQNAKWLWDELNKEDQEQATDQAQPKTVDQQILTVARRATKEALNRYHQLTSVVTIDSLPVNVQESLNKSTEHVKDVYAKLTNVHSLKDVSDLAMQEMFAAVDLMQNFVAQNVTPAILPGRRDSTEINTSSSNN